MYKDLTEAQQKKAIRYGFCGLFANRSTIQEAYDQAATQATSLKDGDKQKMIVCLQVLMNTWAIATAQMVPDPEELATEMERIYDYQGDDFLFTEFGLESAIENLYGLKMLVKEECERRKKNDVQNGN